MKVLRYCPELNEITGGVTSTLLMMQLEYWFEKSVGELFFKFLEPCEDEHYREGGSWCEELGFSKGEFRTAFGRIGKVYKSKKEFKESKDKFEGKMYLSYFDRIKRMTFYMRNDDLVNQVLESLGIVEDEKVGRENTRGIDENKSARRQRAREAKEMQGNQEVCGIGDTDEICRSEEMACPISIDYFIDSPIEFKSLVPYEQIIESYHEICNELPKVSVVTEKLKEHIDKVWEAVGADMSRILEMFHKVRESDFLSGRIAGKFWRANLEWMMQIDKFRDILRDKYAVRHKVSKGEKKVPKFNRIASHNWDFNQLEELEQEYIAKKVENFKELKSPWLSKIVGINEVRI